MTTINFKLEVPADKLDYVAALISEIKFQLTGDTPEPSVNVLQLGRMTKSEFMELVLTIRQAHANRTIKEAYELSEAIHRRYFKKNMYADYESFQSAWNRHSRRRR
nr:hypothetical protein [uncultured Arsenicibacter sp.]